MFFRSEEAIDIDVPTMKYPVMKYLQTRAIKMTRLSNFSNSDGERIAAVPFAAPGFGHLCPA